MKCYHIHKTSQAMMTAKKTLHLAVINHPNSPTPKIEYLVQIHRRWEGRYRTTHVAMKGYSTEEVVDFLFTTVPGLCWARVDGRTYGNPRRRRS